VNAALKGAKQIRLFELTCGLEIAQFESKLSAAGGCSRQTEERRSCRPHGPIMRASD
jgi:hypothetical protein